MMDAVLNMVMAGLVGLVIGGLFMYFTIKNKSAGQSVKVVEEQLQNYQQDVEKHFAKTADLIDNLTDSYKEVFEHLSQSAETLLTEEQIKNQLINRTSREVTIKYLKGTGAEAEADLSKTKSSTETKTENQVEAENDTKTKHPTSPA